MQALSDLTVTIPAERIRREQHWSAASRARSAPISSYARYVVQIASWHVRFLVPEYAKRVLDVCGAALLLTAAAPVLAVAALAVILTDGGPALYWQERVGRHGRVFMLPKLRSMVMDAERLRGTLEHLNLHGGDILFKIRQDPRATSVGQVLRRWSIDELPQLWSVVRGDMSLVGPRPALPREASRYTLEQRRRLDVTPGLTCIWQVSGRSLLPFPVQCRLDRNYIEHQSLGLDLAILLRTIPAVLSGRGAC